MSRSHELSHELSSYDPSAYNTALFTSLGKYSRYGAVAAARNGISEATIDGRVALDPDDFHSESLGGGIFVVGTQPMDEATKDRLLFHDERFDYSREVSYRFTHELMHPLLAHGQHLEPVQALTAAAMQVREVTEGVAGLTSLGSLAHYDGDKKVTEDATELMTMYAWDPDYLGEYTDFLADTKTIELKRQLGLVCLSESATLYSLVSEATVTALNGR